MCPDGISYLGLADRMPLYSFPTHASAKEGATAIPTIRLQVCKQLLPIGKGFSAPALSPHSGSIDALRDLRWLLRQGHPEFRSTRSLWKAGASRKSRPPTSRTLSICSFGSCSLVGTWLK